MELGLVIPELIECDDDSDDDRGADAARAHPFFGLPLPLTWRTHGAVPSCIADLPPLPPYPPTAGGHDDVERSTGPYAAPPAPPATTGRNGMRPLLTAVSLTSGDETGVRVASVASYAPAGETLMHAADNGSIVRGQIVVPSARLAAARSAFAFYFSVRRGLRRPARLRLSRAHSGAWHMCGAARRGLIALLAHRSRTGQDAARHGERE